VKYLITVLLFFFFASFTYSQSSQGGDNDENPRKLQLNNQTTSQGLDAYGDGPPSYTPSTKNDNWTYWDYTNDAQYYFDGTSWIRVSIVAVDSLTNYTTDQYRYPVYNLQDSVLYHYDTAQDKFIPTRGIYYLNPSDNLSNDFKDVFLKRNDTTFVYNPLNQEWFPLLPAGAAQAPNVESFLAQTGATIILSQVPTAPSSVQVKRSGIAMVQGTDFTISGDTITFTLTLDTENVLVIFY